MFIARTNPRHPLMFLGMCVILCCVTSTPALLSDSISASVDGSFRISSQEGPSRIIEFHATRSADGEVAGNTIFQDEVTSGSLSNVDDAGEPKTSHPLFFKAAIDCLVIKRGTAVMSGEITDSTSVPYIGRRVLVVAQDNGGADDQSKTDRITWGIYRNRNNQSWVPSDSERASDEVNPLAWLATDAERPDDEGVMSNGEQIIGCRSFPLSSFSFVNTKVGQGTVRVKTVESSPR